MAKSEQGPFPVALRLSIDDLGEFVLLVGDVLPVGRVMLGPHHAEAGATVQLSRSLHGGAQWTLVHLGAERCLVPGESFHLGGQTYTVRQPDGASPMHWLQPSDTEVPGMIWLAQGADEGFEIGSPGSAWDLGGLGHPVAMSAWPSGLRIACQGGVRRSVGEGDFGGAQPFQEATWTGKARQSFWNSVRSGSGAPLFITLDPLPAV